MSLYVWSSVWLLKAALGANAFAFPGLGDNPHHPLITAAPAINAMGLDAFLEIGLQKRQNTVCGWVSGDPNEPLTCNAGYYCGINTHNWAANCCKDPTNCEYKTACVPYTSMDYCDSDCLANDFVTRCDDSSEPYCYVKEYIYDEYASPFYELNCAAEEGYITVLETTYTIPDDGGSTTPPDPIPTSTAPPEPVPTTPDPIPSSTSPPTPEPTSEPPPENPSVTPAETPSQAPPETPSETPSEPSEPPSSAAAPPSSAPNPKSTPAPKLTSAPPFSTPGGPPPNVVSHNPDESVGDDHGITGTVSRTSSPTSPAAATAKTTCSAGQGNCGNGPNPNGGTVGGSGRIGAGLGTLFGVMVVMVVLG